MSRSYRRPYSSVTGAHSAHSDKRMAARGVRRTHRRALQRAWLEDFENYLPPHHLECPWNNNYSWTRDGCQYYQGLTHRDWHKYLVATGQAEEHSMRFYRGEEWYQCWPPEWYRRMIRK